MDLGGRVQGFYDNNTEALVIKSVTMGGGVVKNCSKLRDVIYGWPLGVKNIFLHLLLHALNLRLNSRLWRFADQARVTRRWWLASTNSTWISSLGTMWPSEWLLIQQPSYSRCQFRQHFMSSFFIEKCFGKFYVLTIWVRNFLAKGNQHKSC